MSYRHVRSPRGVVHAQPVDSDWLVCGKPNEDTIGASLYPDVDDDVTCKVCKRSIQLSRDFRISRALTPLAEWLFRDMRERPGAYLHADRQTIAQMKDIVTGE